MPKIAPKKPRRKKPAKGGNPEQEVPGLLPMMDNLVDQLPEDLKPHGKRIMGILKIAIIAIFAILIIGVLVAGFTGHSDQVMTIFAADIIVVGSVTVAAIVFTTKNL